MTHQDQRPVYVIIEHSFCITSVFSFFLQLQTKKDLIMRINYRHLVLAILCCFFISNNVFGQVVNIEKKRKDNEGGFAGMVSLGLFFIDNGKNISQVKNDVDLQYRKKAHAIILLNNISLMRVNEDDLVNSGFQHLRYNYTIKDSSFLTLEALGQHQYNSVKLLERRFLLGVGPRFRLFSNDKISGYFGIIGMYEYEQRSDDARTLLEFARLSNYLSISWDISNSVSFNTISYYQPVVTEFERYRISSESSFGIKINQALSIKIGFQTTYDSHPAENVQNMFYKWENSLKYVF